MIIIQQNEERERERALYATTHLETALRSTLFLYPEA